VRGAEFALSPAHCEVSETRATLDVAPDQGGWYKVCAAIQETTKSRRSRGSEATIIQLADA